MPSSIGVASFVFGVVFLLAALIGKELKIAAVEVPALELRSRLVVGAVGVVLVAFGVVQAAGPPPAEPAEAVLAATTTTTAGAPVATGAAATLAGPPVDVPAEPCFSDVGGDDRAVVEVDRSFRSDGAFSAGQPRAGTVVIEFRLEGDRLGVVAFHTSWSGNGFEILGAADGGCAPVEGFTNVSGGRNGAPAVFETVEYGFVGGTVAMDMWYSETDDRIQYRAQLLGEGV